MLKMFCFYLKSQTSVFSFFLIFATTSLFAEEEKCTDEACHLTKTNYLNAEALSLRRVSHSQVFPFTTSDNVQVNQIVSEDYRKIAKSSCAAQNNNLQINIFAEEHDTEKATSRRIKLGLEAIKEESLVFTEGSNEYYAATPLELPNSNILGFLGMFYYDSVIGKLHYMQSDQKETAKGTLEKLFSFDLRAGPQKDLAAISASAIIKIARKLKSVPDWLKKSLHESLGEHSTRLNFTIEELDQASRINSVNNEDEESFEIARVNLKLNLMKVPSEKLAQLGRSFLVNALKDKNFNQSLVSDGTPKPQWFIDLSQELVDNSNNFDTTQNLDMAEKSYSLLTAHLRNITMADNFEKWICEHGDTKLPLNIIVGAVHAEAIAHILSLKFPQAKIKTTPLD